MAVAGGLVCVLLLQQSTQLFMWQKMSKIIEGEDWWLCVCVKVTETHLIDSDVAVLFLLYVFRLLTICYQQN